MRLIKFLLKERLIKITISLIRYFRVCRKGVDKTRPIYIHLHVKILFKKQKMNGLKTEWKLKEKPTSIAMHVLSS